MSFRDSGLYQHVKGRLQVGLFPFRIASLRHFSGVLKKEKPRYAEWHIEAYD